MDAVLIASGFKVSLESGSKMAGQIRARVADDFGLETDTVPVRYLFVDTASFFEATGPHFYFCYSGSRRNQEGEGGGEGAKGR